MQISRSLNCTSSKTTSCGTSYRSPNALIPSLLEVAKCDPGVVPSWYTHNTCLISTGTSINGISDSEATDRNVPIEDQHAVVIGEKQRLLNILVS